MAPDAGASGVDRYVSDRYGTDAGNDCTAPTNRCKSIQHALDLAEPFDVVKVHADVYEENIVITRRLIGVVLEGGWTSTFHDRYPGVTTIITGLYNGPVIDLQAESTTIELKIDRFKLNRGSGDHGGAIHAHARSGGSQPIYGGHIVLELTDNLIRDNGAFFGGAIGAIASQPDDGFNDNTVTLILSGNEIRQNRADSLGGAISISAGVDTRVVAELSDNIIESNTAGVDGGALGLITHDPGATAARITLKRNVIMNNTAGRNGGGVALFANGLGQHQVTLDMENNIIADNLANEVGGGLYLHAEWGTIEMTQVNDTITGNDTNYSASSHGAGIHTSTESGTMNLDIVNSIIYANHRHPIGAMGLYLDDGVNAATDYCIIAPVGGSGSYEAGAHDVNSSPGFVDRANGDYHLASGSVAIDAGICGVFIRRYFRIAPYEDFEGDLRPGDWITGLCDIGADEYMVPEPSSAALGVAAALSLALLAARRRKHGSGRSG